MSDLEHKANDPESNAHAEKAKEAGFLKKTFTGIVKLGIAAGATAIGLATVGPAAPLIGGALGAGQIIGGLYKKLPINEVLNNALAGYTAVNLVLQPMIKLDEMIFPYIDNSTPGGVLARTAISVGPYLSAFILAFRAAAHLYNNNLNPKGITKSMFENYWREHARLAWVFAPGLAMAANGLGTLNMPISLPGVGYQWPTFAPNALFSGIYNTIHPVEGPKKHEVKHEPAPQAYSAPGTQKMPPQMMQPQPG